MLPIPPGSRWILALAVCGFLISPAAALEIRTFSATRHKRLLDFPGQPIYPQTPYPNPGFPAGAEKFLGIGWPAHPTDWTRQMALVSPWHFVCAAHYPPGADWQIVFLGSDGNQHLHGISKLETVTNSLGQPTDLLLCTLSTPVLPTEGATPFPVMNLPNDTDYAGKQMIVCGSFVTASTATAGGAIALPDEEPGFNTTRFLYFDYNQTTGNPDDCRYEGGDSGAPSFVMTGGQPALVGTASSRDDLPDGITRNYMTMVPDYLGQLDALMEARGYHIRRTDAGTAALSTIAAPNGPQRRLRPGSVTISAANAGPDTAHNPALSIHFSQVPTTLSGPGWFCEFQAPDTWLCRRGGIPSGSQAALTASWEALPNVSTLGISLTLSHDGADPQTSATSLALAPSYAAFTSLLANAAESADPDGDGIPNLLEYALGGDPAVASQVSPSGFSLLPRATVSAGNLLVTYPRRTDAANRGISETVEFSPSPAAAWQSAAPAGSTISTAPWNPPAPGFEQVTLSVPLVAARLFVRLRVSLDETEDSSFR